jgi:stearoyl-CoA desaturase (delta-9 desaturase)
MDTTDVIPQFACGVARMEIFMKNFISRIAWGSLLFLGLTPLIGFGGLAFLIAHGGLRWATVALALALAVITGLAVTAGYHRLFAHKSYEAKGLIKALLLFFGAASFENSALRWASDHRNHHKFVDTDQDPYNIQKGFWHAHMGWILFKRTIEPKLDNVADLETDRLVMFQERWFPMLSILSGFAFPMAVASLWGDALGGLLLAGFLRIVLNHHFTFSINSICHYWGAQPYSERNSARDSFIPALFTYGEGYHNYHHTFPSDYRNGIRAYHWDPTKWLIGALAWIGQTSDLRRISSEKILRVRIRMDEKRLHRNMARSGSSSQPSDVLIDSVRENLEATHTSLQSLRADYKLSKRPWIKIQMRKSKRNFRAARLNWRTMCRTPMLLKAA